jgi:hypothetical protein
LPLSRVEKVDLEDTFSGDGYQMMLDRGDSPNFLESMWTDLTNIVDRNKAIRVNRPEQRLLLATLYSRGQDHPWPLLLNMDVMELVVKHLEASRGCPGYADEVLGNYCPQVEDMMQAVRDGDCVRLRKVLDSGVSPNATGDDGMTALMAAAEAGQKSCVSLLLQRRAKLDLTDNDGWSALMFAASSNNASCIRALLSKRPDTEIKCTEYGMTAFSIACENGKEEAVEALAVKNGADIFATDNEGNTGRDLAAGEDPPHEGVLALLVLITLAMRWLCIWTCLRPPARIFPFLLRVHMAGCPGMLRVRC